MARRSATQRAVDALPIWGEVAGRYTEDQITLLKALTVGRRASPPWSMLGLAPQWFAGAEPIKGTEHLIAPTLAPPARAKFDALWAFSKDPPAQIRSDTVGYRTSVAATCAAGLLLEASFQEEWRARLPDLGLVMDFDPLNDEVGDALHRFRDLSHPVYATLFDMRALNCFLIPETAVEDLERAARVAAAGEPEGPSL